MIVVFFFGDSGDAVPMRGVDGAEVPVVRPLIDSGDGRGVKDFVVVPVALVGLFDAFWMTEWMCNGFFIIGSAVSATFSPFFDNDDVAGDLIRDVNNNFSRELERRRQ